MACTEAYKEHIVYSFNAFCKVVIRYAAINALRDRNRRRQKEISFEYLTEEKFYPLSTSDEFLKSPYEQYPVTICGQGEKLEITSKAYLSKQSERLFYCALIGYIHYEAPEEEKNFTTLLEMINASEAREDDPEFQSPVDLMFERLEEKDPEHFAVRQYKKFLLSAGKTRSSILISCGARLAPFDIRELRELMETDEMELDTLGDRKTALFVIISDTDDTFNFVVSILYTQLFNLLCDKADDEYGGWLPVHGKPQGAKLAAAMADKPV